LPALPRTIDRGGVQQKQRACVGDAIGDLGCVEVFILIVLCVSHRKQNAAAYHCFSIDRITRRPGVQGDEWSLRRSATDLHAASRRPGARRQI